MRLNPWEFSEADRPGSVLSASTMWLLVATPTPSTGKELRSGVLYAALQERADTVNPLSRPAVSSGLFNSQKPVQLLTAGPGSSGSSNQSASLIA